MEARIHTKRSSAAHTLITSGTQSSLEGLRRQSLSDLLRPLLPQQLITMLSYGLLLIRRVPEVQAFPENLGEQEWVVELPLQQSELPI